MRNALPSLVNLFGRGIDVDTISCKFCDNGGDDLAHLYYNCSIVRETRRLLKNWLRVHLPDNEPKGVMMWHKDLRITAKNRSVLEAILFIWWWHIWKERNNVLHNGKHEDNVSIVNSIISLSYLWISNRDRKKVYAWNDWIENPLS